MRLACSDYTFPLLDHEQACALIASLGFAGVNIGVWAAGTQLRADEIAADPSTRGREVAERLARHGLLPADVLLMADPDFTVLTVNHPDPAERARSLDLFRRWTEFVNAVGANGLTILPGLDFEDVAHEDSLNRAAEELTVRVQVARDAGLEVSVEPHVGSIVASPDDTRRLFDLCPGLGLTLDHSHFVMQGYAVPDLDPLFGRVRHLHARGSRPDRLQVGMKENEIDYEHIVGGLHNAGFEGFLVTEYLWIDQAHCNECDTLSETILMRDRLTAAATTPHPSTV